MKKTVKKRKTKMLKPARLELEHVIWVLNSTLKLGPAEPPPQLLIFPQNLTPCLGEHP